MRNFFIIILKTLRLALSPELFIEKIINRLKSLSFVSKGANFKVGRGFDIMGQDYISVGENFSTGKNVCIHVWDKYQGCHTGYNPSLQIGNDVTIADYSYISCINQIVISDGVLFGVNTFICDNFHGNGERNDLCQIPSKRKLYSKGPVFIGRNVWLGRNVCIMPNVTIGENSIIGANSVVTKNIPPNSIAVGSPARIIRDFSEYDLM